MKHYHFYTNFHQWFYKWYLSLNYRINDIRLSSSVVLETRPKPIVHHEPDVWDSTCGLRAHAQRWELTLWIDRLRSKSTCRQLSGVQFSIFSENLILDILARVSQLNAKIERFSAVRLQSYNWIYFYILFFFIMISV